MSEDQPTETTDAQVSTATGPRTDRHDVITPRHLNRVVLGMILVYGGISFWLISRSWYQADDFIYLWKVDQPGKLLKTMFTPYVGHLLPGDFLFTWLTQRPASLNWEINAAVTAAGLVLAAVLAWRVLRSLLGIGVLSLTLMIAYLTSGTIIVTSFWWAAAIEYVPIMIGVPLMILLLQRALITPTWINAFLPALALVGTLFFFEKALIHVPFLVALVAITPLVPHAAPTAVGRVKQALRPLVPLLAVAFSYGLLYLFISSDSTQRPELSIGFLGRITPAPAVSTLFPNLVGFDDPLAIARFNAAQFLGVIVILMLLIRTFIRRRSGLLHWGVLLGFIIVNIGLVVSAGRRYPGADRYWSDLVFPMLLLIGLSQVGSRFERGTQAAESSGEKHRPRGLRLASWPVVAMIAFASIATYNLIDHPPPIAATAPESYVKNALRSATQLGGTIELFEQQVPGRVMSAILMKPYNTTRTVLEPSSGDFKFITSTTDPHTVLDSGEITPARLKILRKASGVDPQCMSSSPGPSERKLQLGSRPVLQGERFGELEYRSDRSGVIVASWDDQSVEIPIEAGSGKVTFAIDGGDWRRIKVAWTEGSLCLSALRVGILEPR